jgi:hypothetical protein
MPNKTKSRNNSRNSSRKSTASSQGRPVVHTDDDYGSIVIRTKTPTSPPEVSTPPPSLSPPPPPPPSPWETLGMTEEDFLSMMERVRQQQREFDRERYMRNLVAELQSPSFWLRRIEQLEKEREYFNKKRGWSAADIVCVDRIDDQIRECEEELEVIYAEEDRLEAAYD